MEILLPLIGVVIGAFLQYWFSKASEERKRRQNLQTQSYVDFFRSVSGIDIAQKYADKSKEQEFTVLLTDAKARIAIYGSKEVIKTIASFWRAGARIETPEQSQLFVAICQAMRKDSLPKNQEVPDKDISQLLFGTDV